MVKMVCRGGCSNLFRHKKCGRQLENTTFKLPKVRGSCVICESRHTRKK